MPLTTWAILHCKILRFRGLSFCCQFKSLSIVFSSFIDARTLHGSTLSLRSSHSHHHVSCAVSVASDLFDFSLHFISFLIISLSTLLFLLPDNFNFLLLWLKTLRTSAEDFGTMAKNNTSTSYEPQRPLDYRGLCRIHPGVRWRAAVAWWLRLRWRHHRSASSLMRAEDEPITLKKKACCPVCRGHSVMIERWNMLFALTPVTSAQEIQRRNSENEQQIRTLLERQREKILPVCQAEIRKQEFQADCDRRRIQKLSESIESQQKNCRAHQANDFDEINNFFTVESKPGSSRSSWENHNEMEELKFQSSTFDTNARRRLVRGFQYAESARSEHSHFATQPVFYPPHPVPSGMLGRSWGMPSRQAFGTHGTSGHVFANPFASSSAPYPQELYPLGSQNQNLFTPHKRWRMETKHQFSIRDATPNRHPKVQSSPVNFSGRNSSKIYGAHQPRLQISDLHFDKFSTPTPFACSVHVHNFLRKLCGSKKWKWLILWIIKKNFVICMKNSNASFWSSSRCEDCFSTEQQFPSWKTQCLRDLRELSGHWSQWFCRDFCPHTHYCSSKWWNFEEFDSKWDGILLSMTKVSSDDILEDCTNWE